MDFETWLRLIKHMEIEEYNRLSLENKMYIEYQYYNEGY